MQTAKIALVAMTVCAAIGLDLAYKAFAQPGPGRAGLRGPGRPGFNGPRLPGFQVPGRPAHRSSKAGPPVYDVHMHVIGGPQNELFGSGVDAALALMNRYGVRKAIIMSPPRNPNVKQNFDYPEFISSVIRHQDRLAFMGGGGLLNPLMHSVADPANVTDEIRQKFADTARTILKAGAVGFGEMSSLHLSLSPKHGYSFVPADHPLLLVLADIAGEHDVPIDLHMDAVTKAMPTPKRLARNQNPPMLPATIPALHRLLEHNAKAKIVWAHGGSDQLNELTADLVGRMMDRYPNLYMSLRPVPPPAPARNKLFTMKRIEPDWAKLLKRHPDRFVIGNDCFFVAPEIKSGGALVEFSQASERHFRAMRAFLSHLTPDLARKIAFENAARIYKLDRP